MTPDRVMRFSPPIEFRAHATRFATAPARAGAGASRGMPASSIHIKE